MIIGKQWLVGAIRDEFGSYTVPLTALMLIVIAAIGFNIAAATRPG